ncbi:hypothetical protein LCI18_001990 [Fusarium solani-melongenae]|uniref:Uncharacterized protein n=1 Tax=Fusarium solani subsp. cucurbitae TaxID=2747967 RepID=A0ACD3YQ41_FUSSC|nr:hypothetical protein LCI18_001990 [Fusarium solani-melongenae]
MTSYQDYFHMKTASSSTGLVFAIYGIGTICATPFVGPTNDYLGRRAVMFTGSVIVIVGAVVVGASTSKGMFLAGRFVLGFGVAFCNVSAPVYVGKMAHPVWHGCLETSTRAKGKAFAQLLAAAAATTIQYGSGPAFEKIKYYFYIVFIGWDIIQLLVIYFFWPETKGRTLEELDEVFKAPNPVKKSLEPINVQTIISTSNAQKDHDGQV